MLAGSAWAGLAIESARSARSAVEEEPRETERGDGERGAKRIGGAVGLVLPIVRDRRGAHRDTFTFQGRTTPKNTVGGWGAAIAETA
jgi:hypothetical protein